MKNLHRVIKFDQKAWLIPYIDLNAKLRQKPKYNFEKDFSNLMNNAVFGKTMENMRKHRDIKLVTTERRKNYLVSEPNYHTTTFFTENLLVIEMSKTQVLIKKLVYLGLLILDLDNTVIHDFGMIMQNQNIVKMQNFLNLIQTCTQTLLYGYSFIVYVKNRRY